MEGGRKRGRDEKLKYGEEVKCREGRRIDGT